MFKEDRESIIFSNVKRQLLSPPLAGGGGEGRGRWMRGGDERAGMGVVWHLEAVGLWPSRTAL